MKKQIPKLSEAEKASGFNSEPITCGMSGMEMFCPFDKTHTTPMKLSMAAGRDGAWHCKDCNRDYFPRGLEVVLDKYCQLGHLERIEIIKRSLEY